MTAVVALAIYLVCAIACWAIGHAAGVPDGSWGSVAIGYGGGLALPLIAVLATNLIPGSVRERLGRFVATLGSFFTPPQTPRTVEQRARDMFNRMRRAAPAVLVYADDEYDVLYGHLFDLAADEGRKLVFAGRGADVCEFFTLE